MRLGLFFGGPSLLRRSFGALGQQLEGRFAVDGFAVFQRHRRSLHDGRALGIRDHPHPRERRPHEAALDDPRHAFGLQQRGHRFARSDMLDRLGRIESGVRTVVFRCKPQRFLVLGGKGAQRMLDAVAELAEDAFRHIGGILGDEPDAHPFRANQPRDLFDLADQGGRCAVEKQMRLVEEKGDLGFVGVADLGQLLEELGHQPQKESRIERRRIHQPLSGEDVDHPLARSIGADQIGQFERRLAEEGIAALVLQNQQRTLDRPHRSGRDIAVFQAEFFCILPDPDQHGLQILEIEQRQPFFVRDAEGDVEHAFLHIAKPHHPRQQKRADIGRGRTDGVALLAPDIPIGHGKILVIHLDADGFGAALKACLELGIATALLAQTGKVAFDIGQKDRHPRERE